MIGSAEATASMAIAATSWLSRCRPSQPSFSRWELPTRCRDLVTHAVCAGLAIIVCSLHADDVVAQSVGRTTDAERRLDRIADDGAVAETGDNASIDAQGRRNENLAATNLDTAADRSDADLAVQGESKFETAGPPSPTSLATPNQPQQVVWDFSRKDDPGFFDWPEGWQRKRGNGYPAYVAANIVPRDAKLQSLAQSVDQSLLSAWQMVSEWMRIAAATDTPNPTDTPGGTAVTLPLPPSIADMVVDRFFEVRLDGGRFLARSPIVPAEATYQYQLRCDMRCNGLVHDVAKTELIFVDGDGNELMTRGTKTISGTRRWDTHRIDRIVPPRGTRGMFVRLTVHGSEAGLEDIRGQIGWDNIVITRYPQLQMATDAPLGVYRPGEPIEVRTRALGVDATDAAVVFQVINDAGRVVRRHRVGLQDRMTLSQWLTTRAERSIRWQMNPLPPGFYRVVARVDAHADAAAAGPESFWSTITRWFDAVSLHEPSNLLAAETTIAVLQPMLDGQPYGPFGWSLEETLHPSLPAKDVARYMVDSGVSWLKYPCWLEPDDVDDAERIVSLMTRLQENGIATVGRLDHPPTAGDGGAERALVASTIDHSAAAYFRDQSIWKPQLESVMTRLTLKVRTWQLGSDFDFSFLESGRLKEQIASISVGLQGFGQPLRIALPWPWLERTLPPSQISWDAFVRGGTPPLAPGELDEALEQADRETSAGAETWITLSLLDADRYSRDDRITDLVRRMAAVRSHRVTAAYVGEPMKADGKFLRPDGRPDELYLPFRTTARLIGNLRNVGHLQMRGGSENLVFAGDDSAVWMIWSDRQTTERLYLGGDPKIINVWGRVSDIAMDVSEGHPKHVLNVGPVPQFVVGADPFLLAFRMGVRLSDTHLDALLNRRQKLTVQFSNPQRQSLLGQMSIRPPLGWQMDQESFQWEAIPVTASTITAPVVLTNTAKIGDYEIPIRFDLETDPPRAMTVYRNVSVGPTGLTVNAITRRLPGGRLRVTVEMTNLSDQPQAYDCLLFPPPGRRYERREINVEPGKTVTRSFFWYDADSLVGRKMLLRAIEQNGDRVLNYPITVTP